MTNALVAVDLKVDDNDPGYRKFIAHLTDPATHVDVGIHAVSGDEMVMIASVQEFGTERAGKNHDVVIPARPFIRSTVDERRLVYEENAQRLWQRIIDGKLTIFEGLSLLGQLVESDIRRKIIELREPPNAPSTIEAKGSDNPLIDTGAMVNSVRYAVKTNEDRVLTMSEEGSYQGRTPVKTKVLKSGLVKTTGGGVKKPPKATKRPANTRGVASVRKKR